MNLRSSVKREALEDASEQDTKAENIPLKPDNSNVQERGVSGLKERETKPEDPLKNTIITSKSQGVKTAPCDPSLSIEDDDMPMELTAPPPIRYEITNYLGTSPLAVTPPLPDLSGDMDMDVDTEEMNIPVEIRVASDPSERRRVLMDAVVLPKRVPRRNDEKVKVEPEEVPITLHIKAEPLDEDDKVKLNLLRNNPSVKIKKETILDEEGAGRRLLALGPDALEGFPVDLDERIKAAKTTRAWMSDTFGGSPQGCCPKINTKKFTHGMKNITYKTYVYNPEGPQRPGAHGLEFGCYGNIKLSTDVIRLLMRTNAPLWQFMGLYTWFPSTPLSVDEWNSQTASFKRHWVEKILEKPWARRTRTRIGLRTHFISEPTEEEVGEAYINEEYSNVSAEDIRQALDSGEELIHVWIMKCIGYDEPFQRKIATMPRGWVPPKKQKTSRKKTVAHKTMVNKKVTRKATTAKHRSRAAKAGLKVKRR